MTLPRGGLPQMQKLRAPLVGAQGYQKFPLSKPVVGQNIALHVVPAYWVSTYLVSAFPAHSTSSPNFSNAQQWNQNFLLW